MKEENEFLKNKNKKLINLLNKTVEENSSQELLIKEQTKKIKKYEKILILYKSYILSDKCNLTKEQIKELNKEVEMIMNEKKFNYKLQDLQNKTKQELIKQILKQDEEINRLEKIITLTNYQIKVQDRILKEYGE